MRNSAERFANVQYGPVGKVESLGGVENRLHCGPVGQDCKAVVEIREETGVGPLGMPLTQTVPCQSRQVAVKRCKRAALWNATQMLPLQPHVGRLTINKE